MSREQEARQIADPVDAIGSYLGYRAAQARYWTEQAAKQSTFAAALICLSKAARYRRKVDV